MIFSFFFPQTVLCFWFLPWVESVCTSMGQGVEGGRPLILHLCLSPVQRGKQSKQLLTGTRQSDSPPLHWGGFYHTHTQFSAAGQSLGWCCGNPCKTQTCGPLEEWDCSWGSQVFQPWFLKHKRERLIRFLSFHVRALHRRGGLEKSNVPQKNKWHVGFAFLKKEWWANYFDHFVLFVTSAQLDIFSK